MIVHHPDSLHEGIADGAANEPEVSPFQFLAHGIRFGSIRGNFLERPLGILHGLTVHKTPYKLVERAKRILNGKKRLRITDGRLDLESIPDDPRICEQAVLFPLAVFRNQGGVAFLKCFSIVIAFLEDRYPTQACLRSLKDQKFEQQPVVMDRDTPFRVMVSDVFVSPLAQGQRTISAACRRFAMPNHFPQFIVVIETCNTVAIPTHTR